MKRISFGMFFLVLLAAAFGRPPGGEARAPAPVDRDSLVSAISYLTTDSATGEPRTRYALREGPLREVADYLATRLGDYTGNPVERLSFSFEAADSFFTAENIIARIEGTGAASGAFIISAHFDATASRTTGWTENWQTWPAPGADDNASGVAAVLEAARLFGGREEALPFDILFALFSAEEKGLLGSADFVSRLAEVYGDRIIGVINLDMLGHVGEGARGMSVLANASSGWLLDVIVSYAREAHPTLAVQAINPGLIPSDHQSFWSIDVPAVLIMEPLVDGRIAYPYYHSLLDTPEKVDIEQTGAIADAAAGFLEALGEAPAEITMLPSDILLIFRGYPTARRTFEAGDTLALSIRARNVGASDPPAGSTVRVNVSLETGAGARELREYTARAPAALEAADVLVPLVLGPEHSGENIVHASISVAGMDDDAENNAASLRFAVENGGEAVLMHAMQPNPLRGPFAAGNFCVNLSRPVDAYLELFTIEGEGMGSIYLGERWGRPLAAGFQCLPLGSLFPGVSTIASGVYLYRLVVFDGAASRKLAGRFAVEH